MVDCTRQYFPSYLYGTVQVPGETVLNEQGSEVEHRQKQSFELPIIRMVTH